MFNFLKKNLTEEQEYARRLRSGELLDRPALKENDDEIVASSLPEKEVPKEVPQTAFKEVPQQEPAPQPAARRPRRRKPVPNLPAPQPLPQPRSRPKSKVNVTKRGKSYLRYKEQQRNKSWLFRPHNGGPLRPIFIYIALVAIVISAILQFAMDSSDSPASEEFPPESFDFQSFPVEGIRLEDFEEISPSSMIKSNDAEIIIRSEGMEKNILLPSGQQHPFASPHSSFSHPPTSLPDE